MKRWIHASEDMPEGYLQTTRFNSNMPDSAGARNVLEAIEIAVMDRYKQFNDMCQRTYLLTSDCGWSGTVDEYPEGYYIQIEGTRAAFSAFVSGDRVIRKPRLLSDKIKTWNVAGNEGHIQMIR